VIECTRCHALKPATLFFRDKRASSGRQSQCKRCAEQWHVLHRQKTKGKRQARNRLRLYGLSEADYLALNEVQGGCCASCGVRGDALPKGLAVDHDHTSDKVRGLLCVPCNLIIGLAQEQPATLRKAANYLELVR
jgi:hypothetical protein